MDAEAAIYLFHVQSVIVDVFMHGFVEFSNIIVRWCEIDLLFEAHGRECSFEGDESVIVLLMAIYF